MIDPGFEILNQRGTPMFFSDVFANRPTAGVVGRIFISTDTYAFYRDTGTTWDLIGGPGTGTITGSISAGQVAYGTAANTIGGSNNLYFDSATNRLGIGTISPTETLSVVGTGQFSGNVTIVNNADVLTRLNVQNSTIGALSRAGIYLSSDIGSGNATFGKNSSGGTSYFTTSPTDTYIENSGYGDITIQNAVSGGRIKFAGGGSSTSQMTLFSTGNLGIGVGLTDGGQRLQVTGNVNFGGASGFTWDNTNARLGIGTNAPAIALDVRNGANLYTSGVSANSHYLELISNSSTDGYVNFRRSGGANGPASYYISGGTARFTYNAATGDTILGVYAASPLLFFTNSTERMRLDASGSLGLGVTPSAWGGSFKALQVGLGTSLYNNAGYNGTFLGSNFFYNGTNNIYLSSTTATAYGQVNGQHQWFNAPSGTAGNTITFTQAMTLDASGNLGLGTTSPTGARLQVVSTLSRTIYAQNQLSTGNVQGIVSESVTTNTGYNAAFLGNAANGAGGNFSFYGVGGNIYNAGNTLLGTLVDAGYKLDVNGASRFQANTLISSNGNIATLLNISNTTSGTNAQSYLGLSSDVSSGSGTLGKYSTLTTPVKIINSKDLYLYNDAVGGDIAVLNNFATGSIKFAAGGSSTAQLTLNSSNNLLLGHTSSFTANEKLQVTGTQQNKHAVTYSTGSIQSFRIQKDLTIGSGATISTASTLSNGIFTGDNVFGGSVSVPASSPFANIYAANYYQFSAAGVTVTQDQAAGGSRALSQYYAQNYFKGTNSGTITHMASMQIAGYYNNNTGSITPVITNAYQLLINDINEYSHTFTLTNRWGIYQEGASDRNYMAGKLMLNTTTDTGQRIQINGDIRIDGQTSGTAGGSSGQHLIINCDGTTYKIALLNN